MKKKDVRINQCVRIKQLPINQVDLNSLIGEVSEIEKGVFGIVVSLKLRFSPEELEEVIDYSGRKL